jgi:ligand-binding sensor domain-containing protein/putative methionine-R-sulfoxide reductase with GAF domain
MFRFHKMLMWFIAFLHWIITASAQGPHIKRINTSHGLSDNLVQDVCRDKNGLIWIATANGLNSFNGFTVRAWHEFTDQVFQTRDIRGLSLDAQNRLWIEDADGKVAILDENKRISPVQFADKTDSGKVRFLMPDRQGNMAMLVGNKFLKPTGKEGKLKVHKAFPDSVMSRIFSQATLLPNGLYLMVGSGRVVLLDPIKNEVKSFWKIKNALGGTLLPNGDLLVSTGADRELFRIDTNTNSLIKNYGLATDQDGNEINGYFRYMAIQADGKIIISSGYDGFFMYDPETEQVEKWMHDPLDISTIVSNNTYRIITDKEGFVFITSRTAGLGYYNCFKQLANTRKFFSDTKGEKIFDGFVGSIGEDESGNIFLGSQGGLMGWKPGSGKVNFYPYGTINGQSIAGKEEIRSLCFDKKGRLWVGLNRYGIVVLDKAMKPVKYFNTQPTDANLKIPSNFILSITHGPGGYLWVGTISGPCLIDQETMKVVKPADFSALDKIGRTRTGPIYIKSENEVWMATFKGAYRYLVGQNRLDSFTTKNGLLTNMVLAIGGDSLGNIYVGSRKGLQIIDKQEKISTYPLIAQFPEEVCVAMVSDMAGHLWVAMDNYLACIFPGTDSLRVFGNSYGFLGNGFRFSAVHRAADGKLFFGCNEGVSWFDPNELLQTKLSFSIRIFSMQAGDRSYYFSVDSTLEIPDFHNSVTFDVLPISSYGDPSNRIQYQLQGLSDEWLSWKQGQSLSFSGLEPGTYTLSLQWSHNGKNWAPGKNKVTFKVAARWWQKGWVQLAGAFLALGFLGILWENQRRKVKAEKEAHEIEKAVLYLSSTIHSHSDIDKLLWDVVRNVISKLGFEDCVIYLLDTERKVLLQKAAWGPKTDKNNLILNPIEIPLGNGIVGTVAQTAIAEIVNDTTKDSRYIIDDERRFSEIAVPILDDGQVLGIIDSEHSEKDFFQQRHLTILQTISSLLGSKITKARVEAEKSIAELELVELKRKSAEVEMQALRAQMNPHFMFNSLNSINNFILNNDIDNASSYLTKFSRLMRLILDNSRHDWVSLEQELQALELYIGMESLRFDHAFTWHIDIGEGIDILSVQIPPLLIQPYVENAIWHGLMHRKEPGGHLYIGLKKSGDFLLIEIVDNGVGREAANLLKSKFSGHKKSHGMMITSERMEMVNKVYNADVQLNMEDRKNEDGKATGTYVQLKMKYILQHQAN